MIHQWWSMSGFRWKQAMSGGEKAWRKYLEKSLIFNEAMDKAVRKRIKEGTYTIVIRFLVDINGRITDVKALTDHGYGLEEGAIEIIKKSGKWMPAIQDNKWVNSYRKQPITFYFKNF
jgi:periplasmic protein TonB